jgi:Arc/MetJ family transcription regulator
MSRTNIDIDETLIRKAIRLTGARSEREAVEAVDVALRWEGDPARWRVEPLP